MKIEVGENNEEFTKEANILEELAYRDTWGKGADSFIAMIYERLSLMRDLLAEDGSIYVHCDYRVNSYIRLILDELFGKNCFRNEIVWKKYSGVKNQASKKLTTQTDSIFWYSKSDKIIFNKLYREMSEEYISGEYKYTDENGRKYAKLRGRGYQNKGGETKIKYLDENPGSPITSLWDDDNLQLNTSSAERLGYPTQKPESLIIRIIDSSSNQGDLICDFFCGSGTTLAVAEKIGRKWIGADLGKFAIHTTRKRLLDVQRQLKTEKKNYRAFEILNLGKYERQHYIGVNPNLRDEEKQKQLENKEKDFIKLILHAYKAEAIQNFETFHGKKNNRLVAIGPINLPVTRLFVEEIINECRQKHITKVDILAFEFEMGLFPNIQEEAKSKGIDLALKYIPSEVFDKRAVEKNQIVFHDVSYIEVKPHVKKNSIAVELTDFSVFYNQDTVDNAAASLGNGKKKIVVEGGKIIKVSKDKDGIVTREVLTKKWTDWIDYWSVDFNFESKREIVRTKNEATGEMEEVWTGDFIFENEWQSFRTKKDRSLELKTPFYDCQPGRYKVAVKVVDIFGNDTMKIVDVSVGK